MADVSPVPFSLWAAVALPCLAVLLYVFQTAFGGPRAAAAAHPEEDDAPEDGDEAEPENSP